MPDPNAPPPAEEQLERVVAALRRQLAAGALTLADFDRRTAQVYGAADMAHARAALDDLPPLPAAAPRHRRWGRRHAEAEHADPSWLATDELFRDPSTGRVMRVWLDPGDGSRHYLEEDLG